MCAVNVIVILCFVYIVNTGCHVIRTQEFPLPSEGMTVEFTMKSDSDQYHPISTMKIDINEKDKKVTVFTGGNLNEPPKIVNRLAHATVPKIENRPLNKVIACPAGYIRVGGFCFPDD